MRIRTYSEFSRIKGFKERYEYLRLGGVVGAETFGYDRYLNQMLYKLGRWKRARRDCIIRDDGCDLGVVGFEIYEKIYVHHMNPITIEDIKNDNPDVFNPEFLICTSYDTHQAIHYGDASLLPQTPIVRTRNDTIPWR